MIKIKKECDYVKTPTIMERRAYFYALLEKESVKEPSPFVIGEEPEQVFSPDLADAVKDKLIPLLSYDLKSINPEFSGKVHFLYHEMTHIDWVISKLDENGLVNNVYFIDYKNNIIKNEQITFEEGCDGFQEGAEETRKLVNELKEEKIFTLICDEELPEHAETITKEEDDKGTYRDNIDKYQEEMKKIWLAFKDRYEKEQGRNLSPDDFGPYPMPVQAFINFPFMEEAEEGDANFYYAGQIYAYEFDLCGFNFYLFYHPGKKILAQFLQFT